jgi:hypothetical protein
VSTTQVRELEKAVLLLELRLQERELALAKAEDILAAKSQVLTRDETVLAARERAPGAIADQLANAAALVSPEAAPADRSTPAAPRMCGPARRSPMVNHRTASARVVGLGVGKGGRTVKPARVRHVSLPFPAAGVRADRAGSLSHCRPASFSRTTAGAPRRHGCRHRIPANPRHAMIPTRTLQTARAYADRFPGALLAAALKCLAGASLLALVSADCGANPPPRNPYPAMAPLAQYLMPRDAEIALARSAGPESVTRDAEVLVLGPHGYETAVPGRNGFVCAVQRSWAAPVDDPEFWNPSDRSPICWNSAAARYCVPLMVGKTRLVLAGKSRAEIAAGIRAALGAGEFPPLGPGAMCFMMSQGGHLNDEAGPWHPHLMFFLAQEPAAAWGADLPGSPVISSIDAVDKVTTFMVPVRRWSDGTWDVPPAAVGNPAPNAAAPPPVPSKT